ncbi:DUF2987 domain-containing protein [Photobacterium japonica]|uniref:DUF2987 domain-containing protein n=1 Tax=Photobacterium japonica TaxID=2910235 RepID=UPI003D12A650
MKLPHWFLAGLVASTSLYASAALAQNIDMRYSTLFSKLKQNVEEGHDDVKVAFFLLDQRDGSVCDVHKGWMRKDEHYEALIIPESNELDIPVDSNLRQANPDVTFVIDEGITCDVSMQVIARDHFDTSITQADVARLTPQMQVILSDLGGMFSDWFMPEVEGVVVHLSSELVDPIQLTNGTVVTVADKKAVLKLVDLAIAEKVDFPVSIVKVTPWLPRD